jgi:homoserine dehydrogenase
MKPIQVGLLGFGTVGGGTFQVLARNQDDISRRAGRGIEIGRCADLDLARRAPPWAACGWWPTRGHRQRPRDRHRRSN